MFFSCTKSTPIDNPLEDAVPERVRKPITVGIGEVVSINLEQKFVLIEVKKPQQASKAISYYIERGDRRAVLRPTGEQIRKYIAADIISGTAALGDPVLVEIPKPKPVLNIPTPPEPVKPASNTEIEQTVEDSIPQPPTLPEPTNNTIGSE